MIARRSVSLALVWLCAAAGALVWCSAPALGQRLHEFSKAFGGEGSGDGQLVHPGALAVNEETGDVYVIDRGNDRVEIFNSSGAYVGQFNGSASPTGPFSWPAEERTSDGFAPEGSIAIDNSKNPLDPSKGDVYVLDTGHRAIDKFTSSGAYVGQVRGTSPTAAFPEGEPLISVAIDPNGGLWVQIHRELDEFNDASPINEYETSLFPKFPEVSGRISGVLGTIGFAFDSEDDFYAGNIESNLVREESNVVVKFTDTGGILNQDVDGEVATGVGVDLSSDDVYIDHETNIAAYAPSGPFIERFGSSNMHASSGVAINSSNGTVYTSSASNQEVDAFTAFTVPDATTGSVSNIGETSVTVGGMITPDGLPTTSCVFEYGTSTSYGQSEPCAQTPGGIGSGGEPVAVSAQLRGLAPLTEYHYRLKAFNAKGSNAGQDRTFVTPESVGVSEESVSDVSSTSALFSALINPGDSDTAFHFEYGTSVSYGESVPVPDGDLGAGTSSEQATVRAQELLADTTYHVRLVASNVLGTVYGPDQAFTTQAGGGSFELPDGRQWELVSPPSKEGASIEPLHEGAIQASEDGSAITYIASAPVTANPAGNPSPAELTQVLSRRGAGGWSTEDIATPHRIPTGEGFIGETDEYLVFSPDLSRAIVQPAGATPLAPEVTEHTVYIRDDGDGSYVPLVTAGNVPPGTTFGSGDGGSGSGQGVHAIAGTPDLSHVLLVSSEALTKNAIPGTFSPNIYEWSAGQLQLVNVRENETVTNGAEIGGSYYDLRGALSDDGSRVFWNEVIGPLYMRDTVTEHTVQVDAPAPGVATPPRNAPRLQLISTDGSKVFFLENQPLTADSTIPPGTEGDRGRDLYVDDTVTGVLRDLSVDPNAGEQADVQDMVLGASEEGSVVYFVAKGVLAGGAQSGEDNLYVESETGSTWSLPRLIAVLTEEDARDWGGRRRRRRRRPWDYDVEGLPEWALSGVYVEREPDGL